MSMDDNDGQMIFRDLGGLKLTDICLAGDEKPRKNLTQETCPDRGSNPGSLHDKRACYHLLHSGGPMVTNKWTLASISPVGLHGPYWGLPKSCSLMSLLHSGSSSQWYSTFILSVTLGTFFHCSLYPQRHASFIY